MQCNTGNIAMPILSAGIVWGGRVVIKTLRISILLFQLWYYLLGFGQAGMLKNNHTSQLQPTTPNIKEVNTEDNGLNWNLYCFKYNKLLGYLRLSNNLNSLGVYLVHMAPVLMLNSNCQGEKSTGLDEPHLSNCQISPLELNPRKENWGGGECGRGQITEPRQLARTRRKTQQIARSIPLQLWGLLEKCQRDFPAANEVMVSSDWVRNWTTQPLCGTTTFWNRSIPGSPFVEGCGGGLNLAKTASQPFSHWFSVKV